MQVRIYMACVCAVALAQSVHAHGPQVQITKTSNKLVTRGLLLDDPYSALLTAPKSVYVMPALEFAGTWYSRPNDVIDPILQQPSFPSGPGFVYGYDLADGGPQDFEAGSIFSVTFTAGLKRWNGSEFDNAGATELKAFRGSDPAINTPAANFAVTSDTEPFDSVSLAAVAANYGTEGAEIHASLRFSLLGDGASPTSSVPDGVYLVSMQLSSTQSDLAASDPYYFVLNKNTPWSTAQSAVGSLGIDSTLQQWTAPEPSAAALIFLSAVYLPTIRLRTNR